MSPKRSLASPWITTLGFMSPPAASRRPSPNRSAVTCWSSTHSPPRSSIMTRIGSTPACSRGLAVSGRSIRGPLVSCGAITMKMISSTSTTSTNGGMLVAACILAGSAVRIRLLVHGHDRHLGLRRLPGLPHHDYRNLEQAVHELGRGPVHLDLELLELAREVVVRDDGRDRDEDAQRGRDQSFGDTSRDRGHAAGPRGRDASEGADDPDHGSEQPDERGRGPDGGQVPEASLQLNL